MVQLLILSMKSKIRNLLKEPSRPQTRSYERISYTRAKTRPSYDDELDQSVWNNSYMGHGLGSKSNKPADVSTLLRQNSELKQEIFRLKSELTQYENDKQKSGLSLPTIMEQNLDQSTKLKDIIEKSYYSIREMEREIKKLTTDLVFQKKSHINTEKKMKLFLFEKEQLAKKLANIVSVHQEEIKICNQRINTLEKHVCQLIDRMEGDQNEWRRHMQELKNFKKFSFKRTYQ